MGRFEKNERRRYPRINTSLRISYQLATDTLHSDCRGKDISEGGVRFTLHQKLEIGMTLKMCLCLQECSEPVWVVGKVVWTRETPGSEYPYEAGIEFTLIEVATRSKIKENIQIISRGKK